MNLSLSCVKSSEKSQQVKHVTRLKFGTFSLRVLSNQLDELWPDRKCRVIKFLV